MAKVSLEMIARRAGVSKATVSRALRNFHWTADATAQKVQQAAAELGYEPDARLTELMVHLRKRKQREDRPVLAMLHVQKQAYELKSKGGRNNATGALHQAEKLGYTLEMFNLYEPGMTPKRLSQIWWNRGIAGVIVHPLETPQALVGFQWSLFSWVTLNYTMQEPLLHRVVIDYQQVVWLGMEQAFTAGCKRVGMLLPPRLDERTRHHYRSAYLGYRDLAGARRVLPLLLSDGSDAGRVSSWIARYRPDAILVPGHRSSLNLQRDLSKDPASRSLRIINLSVEGEGEQGIYQDSFEVGAEALRHLVQLIHNGEKGIPAIPKAILIPGSWRTGDNNAPFLPASQPARRALKESYSSRQTVARR